jgi:cytochrome c
VVRRPRGRLLKTAVATALSAVLALPTVGALSAPASAAENEPFDALVFSKTAGFRHDSIPAGIAAIQALGAANDFRVTATEDAAAFTDENLAQYEVVIWLSTTGDVLNAAQQAAFERYIQNGGGYAGIHAASDTEYSWDWYGDLVGAYFANHPAGLQTSTVKTEDLVHPSTAHLPPLLTRTDEMYAFQSNPRDTVHVLQSLDESTYSGGTMGLDHPISWCQDYDGGRAWYTGFGHTNESFSDPQMLQLFLGGIQTAAGVVDANCQASQTESFDLVALDENTASPMDFAPLPDGRVIYVDRFGPVRIVQANGGTVTAANLNVTTVHEYGIMGVTIDPDFEDNGWVYLTWSPAGSTADRVSRFTLNDNTLDLASEKVLIEIPVQRQECCHAGGALQFDSKGNLYISTGDNSNPFSSDGYTPIDERPGRAAWDAQRTSGNTNSLSGKVLRITPQDDGTYTVPEGNLFAPGTERTRAEIFAMGLRNPFTLGIDPRTDTVLVGEYGPDAGSANPNRGPRATVEWNALTQPGNYGWPYCNGGNQAFNDYNFATSTSGPKFDCANLVNDSPNNTGLTNLPPAIPATVWYNNNGAESNAPEIGGGGAPTAGPVYVYDESLQSDRKWPEYWDGKAIFGEWNNGNLYSFQMAEDETRITDINRVFEPLDFKRIHRLKFGYDGALYLIEWGTGFNGNNTDSGLYRLDYISGSRPPIARATADKTSGPAPLTVAFSSQGSRDPDGGEVAFAWDFTSDGTVDWTEANPTFTYSQAGNYTATLTVTDPDGRATNATVSITAGNTAPTVTIETPPNGGFFTFGDVVQYKVTVTDPEDGEIDCQNVVAQPALGHDDHAHPGNQYRGCEGAIPIEGDAGHAGANIFGVINVTYTDKGGANGAGSLSTVATVILQPKHQEAEFFESTGRLAGSTSSGDPGVQTETTGDAGGGLNIGYIEKDDWFAFEPVNLTNMTGIRVRAASQPGGTMSIRWNAPDGPEIGTVTVPATDWQAWSTYDVSIPASTPRETGTIYFVNTAGQYNVNWVEFVGRGVTDNESPTVELTATPVSGTAPLKVDFAATATDPDGNTPLTYEWSFGDNGSATGATASHTYTQPGTYTARVTVRDARGATATETVEIRVAAPATQCFTGRSDDFLGDSLDRNRWTVLRENQELRVVDGNLVLPTSRTDIYQTDNTNTPNIVLQPLPAGAFQATTKLTLPTALGAYQQTGLVIYGNDDNYIKFVFSGRNTSAADAASRVMQLVKETNASATEINSAALGAAFPGTAWLRLTSDGTTVTASYSTDGTTFTPMAQTVTLAGISHPQIGFMSVMGNGRPATPAPVDGLVDWFHITPDDTAVTPGPNDEFDGTSLDQCRWSVVRPDAERMRVRDGNLELDTTPGDVYGESDGGPKNFVLQAQPEGDWTVETKIDASALDRRYQQAGLIAYVDDDNYVKFDFLATNQPGSPVTRNFEIRSEIGDVVQNPQPNSAALAGGVWHLRLAKEGSTFTGSYSADGQTWTAMPSLTNAVVASSARLGVFTLGAEATTNATVKFDYFRVLGDEPGDETPPTVSATLDPAQPNGDNGWYTTPVSVTLAAQDDSEGAVTTEYRLDSGEWTAYAGAVVVTGDGEHTLQYRATDAAGNVSEVGSVSVKIDANGPDVTVTGVSDGGTVGHSEQVTVGWTAADAVSGVASTSATLDGAAIASGTELDLYELALGEHTLVVTSTDNAGNVTTETVVFDVTTSLADLAAFIVRFNEDGTISAKTRANLEYTLDKAIQAADSGSEKYTLVYLGQFVDRVNSQVKGDARDLMVRQLLRTDAEALIEYYEEQEAQELAQ